MPLPCRFRPVKKRTMNGTVNKLCICIIVRVGVIAMLCELNTDVIEIGKDEIHAKAPTPMQEINEALKSCSFGLFHARLLCTSLFGLISGIIVSNATPYILPNAECDLNMNLLQKGILNATPFVGMVLSSMVAGFLTDTFGRKIFLVGGFGGICLFTVFSALSQSYEMLVAGKFFEGMLFAAAFSPAVTFTSEYCHEGIRDRVMLFQSSFQSVGQILLALISWGVLTQEWKYTFFNGSFVLYTWNFYLLISALWSLTACVMYCFLPESPKFLLTQHKYREARETLIKIYQQNTGKPADTFPYADLWKTKVNQAIDETPEKKAKSFTHVLVASLHNCKPMFRKPLGPYLALFCSLSFLIMVLFNVIRLWFPQLSTIVEHYGHNVGADGDLCDMLDTYTSDLKFKTANSSALDICVPTKSGAETYINSIILGCVSMMPYLVSGVLVNRVGKKCLVIGAGIITIGCSLGLRWASSKVQVVALFSTDMAMAMTMMSLLQTTAIEVFPTTTRTLAISMIMMSGRSGTLFGNIGFPILLNMGCVIPFFTFAGIMICVTLMSLMLPNRKK